MAKLLFTAFLADARNKLNGSVFSKNAYGAYVRNKVTPVNPQTPFQQAQRQMLGSLSASWRGLTEAQRDSWKNATPAFQRTDVFGNQQKLSANVLFVSLNKNILNAGGTSIDTAPSPVQIPTISVSDLTASAGTGTITFSITPSTAPAGYSLFVKATGSISPGKSFVKNLLRFIGVQTIATGSVDIATDYIARFGSMIEGQRISIQAYLVNTTTGQAGVPVSATTIVAV